MARTASEGPQLRTLLLTDLVDSTGLVERMGDTPASELFREHDRLVLTLQQAWRGRLIDRSDGLLLLFERPIDGLGFALDYTRGLHDLGLERGLQLQARAGLHVGEVLTWKNSDAAVQVGAKPLEVEGLAKPMAARLMSLARPGQILLSAVAESLTRRASRELGERGSNLLWKSYGRWRFKGVPQPQEIYEVGEVGLAPLRAPASIPKAWRDMPLWRRPAALAAELLLVFGLGVGVWFLTKPQPAIAFAERDWVVMGDLRNLTGEKVLDDSLEQAFRMSLEQSRYVNVLSDMKSRDTLARMQRKPGTLLDRAIASEIALRDGARAVILPTVSEVGGRVRISAEVIDPHTQTTVHSESADGTGAQSALASIDKVTAALRGKLGEALTSIDKDSVPLPQVTTSNLDALRAYALAQKSFGRSKYVEAKSLYERAIELDSGFALAYMGLMRSHNAVVDLAGGVKYLRKAAELRPRMPARDQLYLDAWLAEVDAPEQALQKWQQMATLYPDFFQASANTGYKYAERNRFAEGMPFAKAATSKQYELSGLSWDLVGRLALGAESYGYAGKAFGNALDLGASSAAVRLANTFAVQRIFTGVEAALARGGRLDPVYFEPVTWALDQGHWEAAVTQAGALRGALQASPNRARAAYHPIAVADWMRGKDAQAMQSLGRMVEQAQAAIHAGPSKADAMDEAFGMVAAGILAQRMGDRALSAKIQHSLADQKALLDTQPLAALMVVLQANDLRLAAKPHEAIALLKPTINGGEPFQAHVALMDAYIAASQPQDALREIDWIVRGRGRAYIEIGCSWCQQSLNVVDTTLGHLQAAELLAKAGKPDQAQHELRVFDQAWPSQELPRHLRVRRASVLAMFK